MQFYPSILEYSKVKLQQNLLRAKQHLNVFKQIQNPALERKKTDKIGFHVDVVMPSFAKDRKVMASLGLSDFLECLSQQFLGQKLDLSIHLMGLTDDLVQAAGFLKNYSFNPSWNYTVFVPEKFLSSFDYHGKIYPNYKVGIWYDLGDWSEVIIKTQTEVDDFLLMTVLAGKSGQKLTPKNRQNALETVQKFPQKKFLVDGGWEVGWNKSIPNLQVVSYSGFWREFEERLKLV
jgi:hypothetical protein